MKDVSESRSGDSQARWFVGNDRPGRNVGNKQVKLFQLVPRRSSSNMGGGGVHAPLVSLSELKSPSNLRGRSSRSGAAQGTPPPPLQGRGFSLQVLFNP